MSRKIKYRIWDNTTKRFIQKDRDFENRKGYNLGEFALTPNGKVFFFEAQEGGMETYEKEDVVVSFYTGLKDKLGVEIYEGDIIRKEIEQVSERGEFKDYIEEDTFVVEFLKGSFGRWTSLNLESWTVIKFEVIGNIFENSDLK